MNIDEIIHELNMHKPDAGGNRYQGWLEEVANKNACEGDINLVPLIFWMAYHIRNLQADVERLKNLQEAKFRPGYGINWPKEQGEGR